MRAPSKSNQSAMPSVTSTASGWTCWIPFTRLAIACSAGSSSTPRTLPTMPERVARPATTPIRNSTWFQLTVYPATLGRSSVVGTQLNTANRVCGCARATSSIAPA